MCAHEHVRTYFTKTGTTEVCRSCKAKRRSTWPPFRYREFAPGSVYRDVSGNIRVDLIDVTANHIKTGEWGI